jgi:hypothetical protein
MANNPYAHPEPYDAGYAEPARVSILAIVSFVLSLLCCIPGVGLIGAILGGVSIVRISKSRGRLSGRGLAIAGVVIGLISTLIWVGVAVGTAQSMHQLDAYGETLRALDQRDYTRVRQMLTPAASSAVTDEQIGSFQSAVEAEWGSYQRMPRGLADWFNSYAQTMQTYGRVQQQAQGVPPGSSPLPLPVYYNRGLTLSLFVLDPRSPSPIGAAQSSNIAVFDQQGAPIWLIPPAVGAPPRVPAPPPETAPAPEQPQQPGGEG